MDSSSYQWELVKRLSFNRPAGTPACEKAAEMIIEEVEKLGGSVTSEPFDFEMFQIDRAELKVTEPYEKTYEVTGVGYSGEICGDFPFRYVERAAEYDLDGVDGGMVMMNKLDTEQYGSVFASPAQCFLTVNGKYYDDPKATDLSQAKLGRKLLAIGAKPGFLIRCADGIEMVNRGASRIHCELRQHNETLHTRNLISVIPGTELPDEYITLSAHYDSVDVGIGAYDNMTGVAALLDLYRYFMENKPRRTLVFLWCGAEERGLLGSLEYVKRHPEIIGNTKMEINFDLTGCAIGYDGVSVAAAESVCDFIRDFAKEKRHSFVVVRHAASSDSNSFAAAGIPSFNFYRYGEADIHNRFDTLAPLGPQTLGPTTTFVRDFMIRCDRASQWPWDTAMPEDMAEEVRKYFA